MGIYGSPGGSSTCDMVYIRFSLGSKALLMGLYGLIWCREFTIYGVMWVVCRPIALYLVLCGWHGSQIHCR